MPEVDMLEAFLAGSHVDVAVFELQHSAVRTPGPR